jgi:hypothetical protein
MIDGIDEKNIGLSVVTYDGQHGRIVSIDYPLYYVVDMDDGGTYVFKPTELYTI